MSKCLRIFGAYSVRLTRRHSTLVLICGFALTLTLIFQMYTYRHQTHPHTPRKIGDFDYRPGAFLKGLQPNESVTYCRFQYGFPYNFNWTKIPISYTPELGAGSHFRVIYDVIKGTKYENYSKYDAVTYATQGTPEFLYHIVEIARYWEGPISFAVYVPDFDLDVTLQIMSHLCRCYDGMSKVSMHLFYPQRHLPKVRERSKLDPPTIITPEPEFVNNTIEYKRMKYKNLTQKTRADYIKWVRENKIKQMSSMFRRPSKFKPARIKFTDCAGPRDFNVPTYRREHKMVYPINVGRNVARNASRTNYFIVSDIEMVPSDGLAPKFLAMLRKLMGDKRRNDGYVFAKTVFVVPLFEVERGEEIPRDKNTLVQLVKANRAMYFHQSICPHCQRFPGLQTWLSRPAPEGIEPMITGRREYPYHRWEPLYFGTRNEPWYSEVLSWEGRQDKMIQMLELCLKDYRMIVLDGGFLCHAAASKRSTSEHIFRMQQKLNSFRYMNILINLKEKYMSELCLQSYALVMLDGGHMCHCQPVSNTTGDVFETRLSMTVNLFRFGKIMNALYKKYVNETADGTNPILTGRREYPYHIWEPLYFGTEDDPWYSELLSWEGRQDKMPQMYELCLQSYNFLILDGAFQCHGNRYSIIPMDAFYRRLAILTNKVKYGSIMLKLLRKYVNEVICSRFNSNLTIEGVLRRKFFVYCRCKMKANAYQLVGNVTVPLDSYRA